MEDTDLRKTIEIQNQKIKNLKLEIELLKKENEELKKEAFLDSLTNLNNRKILKNVSGFDCVIMGDVDYFKKINDCYGHIKGDEVLVAISQVLNEFVRDSDIVCRWGGEEFIILLKDCTNEDAYKKALLLKDKIEELKYIFGFDITMSFGISDLLYEKSINSAINNADKALYKSKKNGRNRVTIYEE